MKKQNKTLVLLSQYWLANSMIGFDFFANMSHIIHKFELKMTTNPNEVIDVEKVGVGQEEDQNQVEQ